MDLKRLEEAASELFAEHGLVGWSFRLVDSKRRMGVCKYARKRIELSEYYACNNAEQGVLDTLLHEIAHALAGPKAGHGLAWKAVAVRIGATPRACDDSVETVVHPGEWQAQCPGCNRIHHRYKRPKALSGYHCKCPARSSLTYAYMGDPAKAPVVPVVPQNVARWRAKCTGCGTVHQRYRRPRAGIWRCRCPHRSELSWASVGERT
jgi:predicted SprT family Zn-dependent metalloprotease